MTVEPVVNPNAAAEQVWEEIPTEKFNHVGIDESKINAVVRPRTTYWQDVWRRLRKNPAAITGLFLLVLFIILSIVGPMLTVPEAAYTNHLDNVHQLPSAEHWFGTDALGRDIWARAWVGARVSLMIGFVAAIINTIIGVIVGGVAGYFGGKVDMIIMRIIDVLIAIPSMIIIVLIMVVVGRGIAPLILSFAITGWLGMARLVRGQVLQLKEQEYVMVARTLGASSGRIIFKHLVPNSLGVIIVNLTMNIPQAIFTEAFLSFIGLGVAPPTPSWGVLASDGATVLRAYPTELLFPAVLISLTMLSLNLLGDGLRDALDPKMRK